MSEESSEIPGPGQAIYLFCFARAGAPEHVEGSGIDGQPSISLWRRDAVAAVFSRVSRAEFCGPAAEERLEDLAWVGPHARHHAEVIMNVMRHSPVLPVRLGTLFSSLERLGKLMGEHEGKILRFFDRVEAREEWAVKAWMNRMMIEATLFSRAQAAQACPPAASPGVRYLQEQRLRLAVEKEIGFWVRDICKDIADDLGRRASDFRYRPAQSAHNPADEMDMMSNWAFLVPCVERAAFQERIREANAVHGPQGLCFECSGPWPPYSFVPSLEAGLDA
jgi:hypothetical protein